MNPLCRVCGCVLVSGDNWGARQETRHECMCKSCLKEYKKADEIYVNSFGVGPATTRYNDERDEIQEIEINSCKEFIKRYIRSIKVFNPHYTSYALKHYVEKWYWTLPEPERQNYSSYIANGAFIKAMIELGYKIRVNKNSPNPAFAFTWNKGGKVFLRSIGGGRI